MNQDQRAESSGKLPPRPTSRYRFFPVALVSIALLVAMAGCRSAQIAPPEPLTPEAETVLAPVPDQETPPADDAPLAARINGEALTLDALKRQYDLYFTLSGNGEAYQQSVSLGAFLERYLFEILLLQEARRMEIEVTDQQVEADLVEYLQQTGLSLGELEANLNRAGLEMADARRFFENDRIVDAWSRKKFGDITVSDGEVRAYYDGNPDYFQIPESVTASQILICHEQSPSCDSGLTKEAARALAQRLHQMATPENFGSLAEAYSSDASAARGGRLGAIFKGFSPSAFETAAFSLEEGEISEVVETDSGYHLILVTQRRPAGETPFESVREVIREDLLTAKRQTALLGYAVQLKTAARIEIFDWEGGDAGTGTAASGDARESADLSDGPFPTFQETGRDLCTGSDGRPLILLFSATSCSHCQWVGGVFDAIVQEYVERGLIEAHHYDVESGDDLLTEAVETELPEAHLAIGKEENPDGYLPYFNFGCRYHRIGTGYEAEDDLAAEAEEMIRVIEVLSDPAAPDAGRLGGQDAGR